MKLGDSYKTGFMIDSLWAINEACFAGSERAPKGVFEYYVHTFDVFVWNPPKPMGFAIVDQPESTPRLWTLAVHPEYRGKGLGAILLGQVHGVFPETTLNVRVDNVSAIVLYLKSGYKIEKLLKGYYLNGVDGLSMRRKHDN
jgi:ribosomal protein S18 acetylase RimI-like enzyme